MVRWTDEAKQGVSRVPFFVRKRVRKRVEEEAASSGAKEVTLQHVRICQQRFLNRMEEEVKGYQVETCFGPSGCANRTLVDEDLAGRIETLFSRKDLKSFLEQRVKGPLKMHHEFRVSVSDCPNGCSRPQIVDFGLIGACRTAIAEETCNECGACVTACKENAVSLRDRRPHIDQSRCLFCAQCARVCPTGTLKEGEKGYRILVGGRLGRHPRLAQELPGIYSPEEVLRIVGRSLDLYQEGCLQGERFGEILERTGKEPWEALHTGQIARQVS